ncbi:RCC1 domain-containing protein [Pseudomonas batumici]|uniref:RCC1 domain-containing protein n=1 Tax=Pseudomonas batumici TaxID=226910 RepID=UPI0030D25DA0
MRAIALFTFIFLAFAITRAQAQDDIRQFDFGAYHRCSLNAGGAVECLGESNNFGQIGIDDTASNGSPRPVRVIARDAHKVVTGSFYTCAIVGDALQCWGDIPPRYGDTHKPITLIDREVSDVAAGSDRICAIVHSSVQCIGMGGQTDSDEYLNAHPAPETIIDSGASSVAAGEGFACAVASGALVCWGQVPSYALQGGILQSLPPIRVIERGVSAVSAGSSHVCAIAAGALRCWGDNSRGQVGVSIPDMPPIRSAQQSVMTNGGEQRCARYDDMSIRCRVEHPVEVIHDGVDSVIAKGDATCATMSGALLCWGQNAGGQLGIASGGKDVTTPTVAIEHGVSFAATGSRTCASVDGLLQCSRPCVIVHDKPQCPSNAGFDTDNPAFGLSGLEARLGVWQGTIGTQEIMVCLQRPGGDAAYYYLKHGISISLTPTPDSAGAIWAENDVDADTDLSVKWSLDKVEGNTLTGQWSDVTGQRKLPIRLVRVETSGDPGADCGSSEANPARTVFNAPRIAKLPVKVDSPKGYARKISVMNGKISSVELMESTNGAIAFNRKMRAGLSEKLIDAFNCPSHTQLAGEYSDEIKIEWRAGAWIVLQESYTIDCGGAHGSDGLIFRTWNLKSGREVQPWQWVATMGTDEKCAYLDCTHQPPDKLNDLILAAATRNKGGDECAESVNDYRKSGFYQVRPYAGGLIFTTDFPHVIRACDEDIAIPWAKVAPFLSPEGKKAMLSIRSATIAANPQ